MNTLARLAITAAFGVLVLGGCGDDGDDGDAPDPKADATESSTGSSTESGTGSITGEDYRYGLPDEWADQSAAAKKIEPTLDTAGGETDADDGFNDNVTVSVSPGSGVKLDDLVKESERQLAELVKDLEEAPELKIDGVAAVHHRGAAESQGTAYFLDQYISLDDKTDKIHVITFSIKSDDEDDRQEDIDAVLDSWKWAA